MTKIVRGRWLLKVAVALVCFAAAAVAQTVTMDLVTPPGGPSMDGIYTSPYTATINGALTNIICDDFADETYFGESWTATQYNVATVVGDPTKWDQGTSNQQTQYDEAAWLAEQLFEPANAGPITTGYISYAIWLLFDPLDVTSYLGGAPSTCVGATGNSLIYCSAQGWISSAISATAGMSPSQFSNVLIYTPVDGSGTSGTTPQEFLVVTTPEASLSATLAVELSALVGLIFLMRRRLVKFGAPR